MSKILDQISEAKRLCIEAGRKPVLILIHPDTYIKLRRECNDLAYCNPKFEPEQHPSPLDQMTAAHYELETVFGIKIRIEPLVKDFFLVDDRSWNEQKW